jgi:hypothetical protein
MTGRVQSLRSNVAGNRPTGRSPGELYTNWADAQLGVIGSTGATQDLIAVTFYSTAASYAVGQFVIQAGQVYRCTTATGPGAFNSANWARVSTAQDLAAYLPLAGGTLAGPLVLAADPTAALGASTKQYVDTKVPIAGGTMTGPLNMVGVTNGSDAAPGQIGEVISSVVLSPGVSLGSGVAANITSIALTAGDWDVQGEAWITFAPAITLLQCWISPTSASAAPQAAINGSRVTMSGAAGFFVGTNVFSLRPARVSLSAPATYYLGVTATGGATNAAFGNIWARRVR